MVVNIKNKRELTFLAVGILMVIIVIAYLVFAIQFLVRNVNGALSKENGGTSALRFQLEKAELLKRK